LKRRNKVTIQEFKENKLKENYEFRFTMISLYYIITLGVFITAPVLFVYFVVFRHSRDVGLITCLVCIFTLDLVVFLYLKATRWLFVYFDYEKAWTKKGKKVNEWYWDDIIDCHIQGKGKNRFICITTSQSPDNLYFRYEIESE